MSKEERDTNFRETVSFHGMLSIKYFLCKYMSCTMLCYNMLEVSIGTKEHFL